MRQHCLFKQFRPFAVVRGDYQELIPILCKTNLGRLLFPEIISVPRGNIFVACPVCMDAAPKGLGVARTQINTSKVCNQIQC